MPGLLLQRITDRVAANSRNILSHNLEGGNPRSRCGLGGDASEASKREFSLAFLSFCYPQASPGLRAPSAHMASSQPIASLMILYSRTAILRDRELGLQPIFFLLTKFHPITGRKKKGGVDNEYVNIFLSLLDIPKHLHLPRKDWCLCR